MGGEDNLFQLNTTRLEKKFLYNSVLQVSGMSLILLWELREERVLNEKNVRGSISIALWVIL